jgi:hypothetical protein
MQSSPKLIAAQMSPERSQTMRATIHTEYLQSGAIAKVAFGMSNTITIHKWGAKAVLRALADCSERPVLSDDTGVNYVLRFDGNGVTFDGGIHGTYRTNDLDGLLQAALDVSGVVAA